MNKFRIIPLAMSFLFLGNLVDAQVPQILNYQGRVAVNGTNFDGAGLFHFALVNGGGSTTYWSNGNGIVSLPVSGGLYSVLLGDTTVTNMAAIPATVFTNTDVRLRVWFDGGAGSQQLSPDQRFAAVGYAMMAANVPNGAITSSQLAIGAVTSANIASNTITAANMASGAGVVPSGAFVLSQTSSNAGLTGAGFAPFTTNYFFSGSDWTEETAAAPWSARLSHAVVPFNGQMWVLGGWNGSTSFHDVWSSTDGTNWGQVTAAAPWSARFDHKALVFNGKIWVLGGWNGSTFFNDVWSSSNGTNWTQVTAAAPWVPRFGEAVVFNGKMWMLGGGTGSSLYTNDVWSSSDGTNWTKVIAAAPWTARALFGAIVFDAKMWVLGGFNAGFFNDVWSSADGTNWAQMTSAPWSPRDGPGNVVLNGKMWVLGGAVGFSSYANDVWSSLDGTNWTQVTATAPWSTRYLHGSVVFNGQMWVLGGEGSGFFNDVWSSSQAGGTNIIPVQVGQFYLFQKQ